MSSSSDIPRADRSGASARILTCYYRPKPGGFCKRLFRAIEALLDAGHEVHYLAVVRFPIDHPNCRFHRFPWPAANTDTLLFWAVFHLLAPWFLLYLGLRYRISHAFAFGPTYAALMQPLRLIGRIPLSLFLRGDTIRAHQIKGRPKWVIYLDRCIEGAAIWGAKLFAVSDALCQRVMGRHRWLHPRCCGLLRNDVDGTAPRVERTEREPVRMACVGILEPTKNQTLIVECWKRIPRGKASLSLYGVGPDEARLRSLVDSQRLGEEVRFRGWVPSADIWPNVDILLMPSLYEGSPNAVLEALGRGIPVLASDIAEHREILPPEHLIPVRSVDAWSAVLADLLDEPFKRLAAIAAQQRVAAMDLMFDWDAAVVARILGVAERSEKRSVGACG